MITLQKGAIYKHERYGMIEYQCIDTFANQRNFDFRQVSTGRSKLLSADEVEVMLSQQETIESVKQQRDDLLTAQQDHQRLVRQLDVLLNGEAGAAQQASLCDLVAQVDKFLRDDYGNKHSAALLGLKISIPTDAMEQEIASSVRMETKKLKTKSDMLLAALHGVADTLDELSQEQSVSTLQGGAAGAASGIRLSIIKILGGAS